MPGSTAGVALKRPEDEGEQWCGEGRRELQARVLGLLLDLRDAAELQLDPAPPGGSTAATVASSWTRTEGVEGDREEEGHEVAQGAEFGQHAVELAAEHPGDQRGHEETGWGATYTGTPNGRPISSPPPGSRPRRGGCALPVPVPVPAWARVRGCSARGAGGLRRRGRGARPGRTARPHPGNPEPAGPRPASGEAPGASAPVAAPLEGSLCGVRGPAVESVGRRMSGDGAASERCPGRPWVVSARWGARGAPVPEHVPPATEQEALAPWCSVRFVGAPDRGCPLHRYVHDVPSFESVSRSRSCGAGVVG